MARIQVPIKVEDEQGNVVEGASVRIRDRATQNVVPLYTTEGGPSLAPNPSPTGVDGFVGAWIERGAYVAQITRTGKQSYDQPSDAAPAGNATFDDAWVSRALRSPDWMPMQNSINKNPVDGEQIQIRVYPAAADDNAPRLISFGQNELPVWSYRFDAATNEWLFTEGSPWMMNIGLSGGQWSTTATNAPGSWPLLCGSQIPSINLPNGKYYVTLDFPGASYSGVTQNIGMDVCMSHVIGSTRTQLAYLGRFEGDFGANAYSYHMGAPIYLNASQANSGHLRFDYQKWGGTTGLGFWDRVHITIQPLTMGITNYTGI